VARILDLINLLELITDRLMGSGEKFGGIGRITRPSREFVPFQPFLPFEYGIVKIARDRFADGFVGDSGRVFVFARVSETIAPDGGAAP